MTVENAMNEQRDRQKKRNLRTASWLVALVVFFFVLVIAQHAWK